MSALEQDTSPEQLSEYFRLLRNLTPVQRFKAMNVANQRVRAMTLAGVRLREPEASDERVNQEFVRITYGDEVLRRLAAALTL